MKFAEDVTGADVRATASRQDNCVMVGVDADQAIGGDKPMFDFRFVEGTRADALQKLQDGRHCLVPDHFARETGLGLGDKFAILPPRDSDHPIEYEIAGVVNMDGWHWMSKVGLRNRGGGRSAGLMFSPYKQVRKDFNIDRISFFWMNLDGTATEDEVKDSLKEVAQAQTPDNSGGGFGGFGGGFGGFGDGFGRGRSRRGEAAPANETSTPTANNTPNANNTANANNAGERAARGGFGGGGGGWGRSQSGVEARSADGVREAIGERASGIIWALCQLPLITLAVTALGVVNAVAASVRARRWEMGVLRAMGTTRGSLLRLILAEAVLIGVAACLLSFGFGVLSGYCGTGVTRYVNVRGGLVTPLVIPWEQIAIGFAITLGLCLIAALGPAIATSRRETLSLLQDGRAAT